MVAEESLVMLRVGVMAVVGVHVVLDDDSDSIVAVAVDAGARFARGGNCTSITTSSSSPKFTFISLTTPLAATIMVTSAARLAPST